jgi:hypothetical protein
LAKEYFIWCDESVKKGEFYSNFYGGVLIKSKDLNFVLNRLENIVAEISITEEIKWQKVSDVKLPAFMVLVDTFFELVKADKIKVRIMFTQNAKVPTNLENQHIDNEYFMLYYQFFKHSFGLKYSNTSEKNIYIRPHFDNLPDTLSKRQQFKEYIKGLESTKDFIDAKIKLRKQDITEIDSKQHLPLQFLDIILGAMQFRLNNKHKIKPEGQKRRGKRTIAKDKLYKHINQHIRSIRPNFNIGISTGAENIEERWLHSYRHWCFTPKEFEIDDSKFKNKKSSIPPT